MRSDHLRKHNKTHEKTGTGEDGVKLEMEPAEAEAEAEVEAEVEAEAEADGGDELLPPSSDTLACDRTTSDSASANADCISDESAEMSDDDSEVVVD